MRLKTIPEDFRVRELLQWNEVPDGAHVVHLLHKEKLSTPEALSLVVREANVDRGAIAYAGLKDRQAVTEQYVSIERRAVELRLANLRLQPVGTTDRPLNSKQSQGNAFTVVIRDLHPAKASGLRRSMPSLIKTGFPNYFDDQRFGCLRHGQGFPMRNVLLGDYERALQQFVAEPSPVAITGDVKLKQTLQLRWGDWEACLRIARGPVYQPMFEHLVAHPDDFRGAIEHVPLRQRVIHAFAYQSLLWNRAVSRLLRGGVDSSQRLRIATLAGDVLAWKYLAPERETKLVAMRTPLYGPDGDGGFNYTLALACSGDACDSCDDTLTGRSGECVEADHNGELEYINIACTSSDAGVIKVYSGADLESGMPGSSGCSDEENLEDTIDLTSAACTEDEHGIHEHVDEEGTAHSHVRLTCTGNQFELDLGCDHDCGECADALTGTSGDCAEETHDGEVEFLLVECNGNGNGTVFVFEGSEGATTCAYDDDAKEIETYNLQSGQCVEDEHGHDEHPSIDGAASLSSSFATAVMGVVAAAAVILSNA